MKDFTNREIKLGDTVAFFSKKYGNTYSGRVYNIGEKMVCVEYSLDVTCPLDIQKYKVYPHNCIIIESEDPITLTKTTRIL